MMNQQQLIRKARTSMIIGLIAVTLATNAIILLSTDPDAKNFYGNVLRPLTAAVATGLAIIVVQKQKISGIFGRSYLGLAVGLVLYFIAEIIWGYYSIGLGIEVPFPSLADAFWLAAYAPFGYGLFKLASLYAGKKKNRTRPTIIISALVASFSLFYIYELVLVSDATSSDGLLALGIGIAYPILDAILIVPAVLALLSSGKGYLTSVPWIFISWVFTAIADTIFGFTAIMGYAGELSIWNLFYNAAYLTMAAGLLWHLRHMIFDQSKMATISK
jgi:hypothetical protein